jgi:hypothetical protein
MSAEAAALEAATIRQQCKVLRMPTIAAQCTQLAEQAVRERHTHGFSGTTPSVRTEHLAIAAHSNFARYNFNSWREIGEQSL